MTASKFEKKNHHYVPQFWQRGFRDSNDQLYARTGGDVSIVSPKTIMQVDWLYTVFDSQWRPSDALEDLLSAIEGHDAQLLQRLNASGYIPTAHDEAQLCALLGLQASRHPDVLKRGHNLSREFGELLASVHDHSLESFQRLTAPQGINPVDAKNYYFTLKARTKEQLAEELADLLQLSPQSPQLPVQNAIRAAPNRGGYFLHATVPFGRHAAIGVRLGRHPATPNRSEPRVLRAFVQIAFSDRHSGRIHKIAYDPTGGYAARGGQDQPNSIRECLRHGRRPFGCAAQEPLSCRLPDYQCIEE